MFSSEHAVGRPEEAVPAQRELLQRAALHELIPTLFSSENDADSTDDLLPPSKGKVYCVLESFGLPFLRLRVTACSENFTVYCETLGVDADTWPEVDFWPQRLVVSYAVTPENRTATR